MLHSAAHPASPPRCVYPGLDLLRLCAALLVVVFHLGFKAFADPAGLIATETLRAPGLPEGWRLTWVGWIGVQVFFVLSGAVIAFSAVNRRPAGFARSRVLRLVPVVLIAAVVALFVELSVFRMEAGTAIARFLATIAFAPQAPWIMGQFWTLGIEIGFYALVFLMILLGRTEAHLPALALGLIGASALYWIARTLTGAPDPVERITQLIPLQHGAFFGIGVLLSDQHRRGLRWWHLAGLCAALAVAALQIRTAAFWEGGAEISAAHWIDAYLVFVAAVGLCALSLRMGRSETTGRGVAVLRTMGLATYPLYLLHNHVGKPVMLAAFGSGWGAAEAVACAILASLAISVAVALWIEPPLRALCTRVYDRAGAVLGRLAGRRSRPSPTAAPAATKKIASRLG